MPQLTIYTPTYNRATLLPRVYGSLCRQTCKDFLWLVIDDGSTDNTRELVEEWMKADNGFEIQYEYKENGGVHTARDLAFRICDTRFIVGCDSDDWLTDQAVELWLEYWGAHREDDTIGIISVVENESGERVSNQFPPALSASYQDYTYKYQCGREKHTFLLSIIIKQIPDAPVFENEKLVPEGFKWIQLPTEGQFLLMDKTTRIYEQQADGYIKNVALSRFKNPNGFRASYRQHIISAKYIKPRIKGHLGYIAFSLILKDRHFIKDSPKPFATALLLPFGVVVYWRFLLQKKHALAQKQ